MRAVRAMLLDVVPTALLLLVALTPAPTFDAYLSTEVVPADGFDPPRRARAVANGRVESVDGDVVEITHVFYENHRRRAARSRYEGVKDAVVEVGAEVERGARLGGGTPRVTVDGVAAKRFARGRRRLFVPREEPVLVLVDHEHHQAARYENGRRVSVVEVEFGQAEGTKEVQGDLKTPKGMYFVVHKYRGAFTGKYGDYYGGHWIKLNYPNRYDAERGVAQGVVDRETARGISRLWRRRKLPTQKTRLGGGIGFHGWAGAWTKREQGGLSWGCVVMHNEDIAKWFDVIPKGAMVVIF